MSCEPTFHSLGVDLGADTWIHDNIHEFFADYAQSSRYYLTAKFEPDCRMQVSSRSDILGNNGVYIEVSGLPRKDIQSFFSIFEDDFEKFKTEPAEAKQEEDIEPVIFLGHGRSPLWRDLKDHLQDKHDFNVSAYETGARAGHTIRDIIDELSEEATMAFLVLTAEDEQKDGSFHARQNVIHETGLFQGKLGFSRAIVLLEDGVEAFSNIQGIDQIRFSKGNIKETYGEVLATIRRELGY